MVRSNMAIKRIDPSRAARPGAVPATHSRLTTHAFFIAVAIGVSATTASAQDATAIKVGGALFAQHCTTCHGRRMRNPQWGADLRTFPKDGHDRFVDSVSYGKRTMPPWEDVLKPDQIEALWAYVSSGDPGD